MIAANKEGHHRWLGADQIPDAHLERANRTLSSGVLYAHVMRKLVRRESFSLVRMADGENLIIRGRNHAGGPELLRNPDWAYNYGVAGQDFRVLSDKLLWAGNNCTWLAAPPIGLVWQEYDIYSLFPRRTVYAEQWFHRHWLSVGWIPALLNSVAIAVVNHNPDVVADGWQAKFKVPHIHRIRCSSWQDAPRVEQEVQNCPAQLYFVSGGPGNKDMMVRMAKDGKAVIDVGKTAFRWLEMDFRRLGTQACEA